MAFNVSEILLWLFVINLGIVFGAGLYETRVVVPLWAASPPESLRQPDSGLRFWAFATTGSLTLLTLLNLFAAWQALPPRREWWLAAVLIIVPERISTFAYFIPTMLKLQRATDMPAAEVKARFLRWANLGYLRSAATLAAWLAALRALTLAG